MASSFLHLGAAIVLAIVMIIGVDAFQAGDWSDGHMTTYDGADGMDDDMGGACGYTDFRNNPYGANTAALSTPLFNSGKGCGACYEIRCSGSSYCLSGGNSVIITGTNLCPPNPGGDASNGAWCNNGMMHFDMARPAFVQLAQYEGGYIPIMYRRVPCQRTGGVQFKTQGNDYWLLVFVINLGGAGDVGSMSVKGSGDWINMTPNWGASYQAFSCLGGGALSFQIISYTGAETLICNNVADAGWTPGLTYQATNNF